MDVTPPAIARSRRPPRGSLSASDDDEVLDAMLVELGLPNSGEKRRNSDRNEIIELITPPQQKKPRSNGRADEVVDLTTPPPSPHTEDGAALDDNSSSSQEDTVDFSYSPNTSPRYMMIHEPQEQQEEQEQYQAVASPVVRTQKPPERGLQQRSGPRQARRLSRRLRDLHAETSRDVESAAASTSIRQSGRGRGGPKAKAATSRSRSKAGQTTPSSVAMAVVQMERSLDASSAGESIRTALKEHIYNGKPVPYRVEAALDCRHAGVIRWERRQGETAAGTHVSCAIYYQAEDFLQMLKRKSYTELVNVVRYLQTLVPTQRLVGKNKQQDEAEEPSKFFVIVEGMDRALIELKKQQKKQKTGTAIDSPAISFADLHELSFQLFMDVGAHTKFTCDLDATANYVALLTRELVVASYRATALEEFLESVPRYNSFRVTRAGGTASDCANAWLRMLQVVPGVSEDKAQSLLDHFPTFDSLMRAYRDPDMSREEKEDLVSDKLHDGRIERALSKRIFSVFCETNPDAVIS